MDIFIAYSVNFIRFLVNFFSFMNNCLSFSISGLEHNPKNDWHESRHFKANDDDVILTGNCNHVFTRNVGAFEKQFVNTFV